MKPAIRADQLLDLIDLLDTDRDTHRAFSGVRVYIKTLRDDPDYQRSLTLDEGPTLAQVQRQAVTQ